MGLSEAATLASIFSSVAVAISLFYLALQVRQAEKNQRSLMQQGRADRVWEAAFRVAEPTLSSVFNKGMRRPEDLCASKLPPCWDVNQTNSRREWPRLVVSGAAQSDGAGPDAEL